MIKDQSATPRQAPDDGLQPDPGIRRLHIRYLFAVGVALLVVACESPIEPPSDVALGTIRGIVEYVSEWPPGEEIRDLRFVAMRFIPSDTADFLQLNRLEFSDRLQYFVDGETIILPEVPAGTYPFAVVARQRTTDVLSWQALGIYNENNGVFVVARDETVDVAITVDFDNLPDFP